MRKVSERDEIKGKILLRTARIKSQIGDNDKARADAGDAHSIFKNTCLLMDISVAELLLGTIYNDNGAFQLAIDHYKQSLLIKENLNDIPGSAACLFNLAVIKKYQNQINEAMDLLDKAYLLYTSCDRALKAADVIVFRNSLYYLRGSYQEIINTKHLEAVFREFKSFRSLIIHYQYLADAYFKIGNYKLARYYYDSAIKTSRLINNPGSMINMIMKKAYYFYRLKNYSKSIKYYKEAADTADNYIGINSTRAMAYYNYASISEEKGDAITACNYFSKVIQLASVRSDIYVEANEFLSKYKKEEK